MKKKRKRIVYSEMKSEYQMWKVNLVKEVFAKRLNRINEIRHSRPCVNEVRITMF